MRTAPLLLLLSLPLALRAQATPATPVVGLAMLQTGATSSVLRQDQCAPFAVACGSVTGPVAPSVFAGGAAYDPARRSLWFSEGQTLGEIRLADCALLCPSLPATRQLPNSVVSGLALSVSRRELYQLESQNGAIALTTYDLRVCPPAVLGSCQLPLGGGYEAGGLAYDEIQDRLLLGVSTQTVGGWFNFIMLALRSAPCTPTCRFVVDCNGVAFGSPITGLGYDACRSELQVSTANDVASFQVSGPGPGCSATWQACCPLGVRSMSWIGLDVESRHPAPLGQSCTAPPCPSCPAMALVANGDPALGNASFALDVAAGPSGTVALLFLSIGSCRSPGLPVLCGQLHLDVAGRFFYLGFTAVSGTAACDGQGSFPLGIPVDAALCGAQVCTQSLVACVGGATFGLGLTNAVAMTLGG